MRHTRRALVTGVQTCALPLSDDNAIFDRIRALMIEGGFPPTPVNYEFWYRYVTGADPRFVEEIDVLLGAGPIDLRTLSKLRAKFYGQREEDAINDLLEEPQGPPERLPPPVMQPGGDTRPFKQ